MGDLISRQAALDAIHCDITVTGRQNAELVAATIGAFADRIKALPSVQPKRGKWIHHEGGYSDHYECTACGKAIVLTGRWKFCPNCGADMRGEAECVTQ